MLCPPRREIEILSEHFTIRNPFDCEKVFCDLLSEFTGAPFVVLTDSCTHGLELVIRLKANNHFVVPNHTYISVPFIFPKIGLNFEFNNLPWEVWYPLNLEGDIIDSGASLFPDMYQPGKIMCLSFQHKKPISVGRGGAILLDDLDLYDRLYKMKYDGRSLTKPWALDSIDIHGFHYYMTPEDAARGSLILMDGPKENRASYLAYPDLSRFKVFDN